MKCTNEDCKKGCCMERYVRIPCNNPPSMWKEIGGIFLAAVAATLLSLLFWPVGAKSDTPALAWRAHATAMELTYKLPIGLVSAICEQESHWRNVPGQHGEIGVCQLKPSTAAMVCPSCVGNAKNRLFMVGSKGDEVARIQAVLARDGYYRGALDGIFGFRTHQALTLYQQNAKLATDGVVGPQTWAKLFGRQDPFPGQSIAESLWDPYQNIEWAARYLAWIRDNVADDPAIMIAAYNGGPANPVVVYLKRVKQRIGVRT